MIGAGFIVRVLQIGLYLVVAAGLLYVFLWIFRLAWEIAEEAFSEQFTWLRTKLPKFPKRKRKKK